MALKDQFDSSDWERIVALPMFVGMAVTAADPGGLWGALRESTAMAGAIAKARSEPDGNELVLAAANSFEDAETRSAVTEILKSEIKGRQPEQIVEALLGEVARLATLIDSKAPEVAPGFKSWLVEVAGSVAEAGTEGGFLGFGGVKVSDQEKTALSRIATALGVTAA